MAMSNTKLFFLTLRNAFSKGINRELIGYSIESKSSCIYSMNFKIAYFHKVSSIISVGQAPPLRKYILQNNRNLMYHLV